MSAFPAFVSQLTTLLSPGAKVLTDSSTEEFQVLLGRWSDIDKQTPGAIVLVTTEEDVVETVKLAVKFEVPFVPKSGGHSYWSTIGESGIIIDLSLFKGVEVDKDSSTVTVIGGTQVKEANDVAFESGLCVPLASANSVGVIPQAIGGGISALSGLCGYTSDNILSARLITATGDLITISDTSHPDLLWALRGAGQFFGLVTSVTLRAYPLSILGTPDATVWTGTIVFPVDRLADVLPVFYPLVADESVPWTGLFIVAAPPPNFQTVLLILPVFFGTASQAEAFLEPLKALGPAVFDGKSVPFTRANDGIDPFCVKGGFKKFSGAGMNLKKFEEVINLVPKIVEYHEELRKKAPDAGATAYAIEWNCHVPKKRLEFPESAYAHKDVKVWVELLSWYTDSASHGVVNGIEEEVLTMLRQGQAVEDEAAFQNWTRTEPIERRYRGKARLEKLRALKRQWDPRGLFTTQLLS
ncbi:fad binding domain containing protein [Moniliophthora roreri]|uniref:FAD-binding PCMH-type domain-containing protein n=1 Tax=Moniliophthora roreri TaxID=221103 RepID=A0A0W0F329_MONRR|nr:fad binding domain containing protein [Moniliophthora roreri]